jgi:hypothetical protein
MMWNCAILLPNILLGLLLKQSAEAEELKGGGAGGLITEFNRDNLLYMDLYH